MGDKLTVECRLLSLVFDGCPGKLLGLSDDGGVVDCCIWALSTNIVAHAIASISLSCWIISSNVLVGGVSRGFVLL